MSRDSLFMELLALVYSLLLVNYKGFSIKEPNLKPMRKIMHKCKMGLRA
jgi:hypothetical protein